MSDVMENQIETIEVAERTEANGTATVNAFLVVAIDANRTNRYVEASIHINRQYVGRLTAADNHLDGVISSAGQITTIPIPAGTAWEVKWNVPNNNNEVRVWFIRT